MQKNKEDIGVIIGRFQLDKLHRGHLLLIEHVLSKHKKVIIFLGISPTGNPTRRYPIEFGPREKMIREFFPGVFILPIKDMRSDSDWSKTVDNKIRDIFPHGSVRLYGGRDSFIPHYNGKWPTEEFEALSNESSTEIRESISREIRDTEDFRAGIIYQAYNRYPNLLQCVDIAPIDSKNKKLLLCKKPNENKLRFIGGFVDPSDNSLESAIRREFREEAGPHIEIESLTYIASLKVDDWRYKSEIEKIMTVLFMGNCIWGIGKEKPGDDIEKLEWIDIKLLDNKYIQNNIVDEHKSLITLLMNKLNKI